MLLVFMIYTLGRHLTLVWCWFILLTTCHDFQKNNPKSHFIFLSFIKLPFLDSLLLFLLHRMTLLHWTSSCFLYIYLPWYGPWWTLWLAHDTISIHSPLRIYHGTSLGKNKQKARQVQPERNGHRVGQILMFGEANQFDSTRCLHWVFLFPFTLLFSRLDFGVVVLPFLVIPLLRKKRSRPLMVQHTWWSGSTREIGVEYSKLGIWTATKTLSFSSHHAGQIVLVVQSHSRLTRIVLQDVVL